MKKHRMKKLVALFLLFAGSIAVAGAEYISAASSKEEETETIDFRVLATGDLHGQVTSWNYETGKEDATVGLSKLYTLIKQQRKAVGNNNTLLVDAGDCLYDYSTNYIYNNYPEEIQPIYRAMSTMRYDCITLGNHDFDYPWDYLYDQLDRSGLLAKTFVCNAVYTESGESPFRTSAIYTRKVKTSEGRRVTLKVGVIGATKASFSTRRYRYSGFLDGLDIYTTVKTEAAQLKEDGADIVIAFIHGGLGLKSGSDTTVQAGARLAALKNVDAVICSHTHETFPSTDSSYSSFSNVNESKGLISGTPVVATGSHANALGVISFELAVDEDGNISILDASTAVKAVKASTKEDSDIVEIFSEFHDEILSSYDTTKYTIASGITYTNADCIVQDSDLYQLMNEAKLRYAASYVADYAPEYSDLPIVAATINFMDSKDQTVELSGTISETDVAALIGESSGERSSGYIHIYKLSGANLIEWLEYNASIYGTIGTPLPDLLSSYAAKNPSVSSLTRTTSLKDWSNFFAFDGVSYEIDLSVAPRYNSNGNLINYTRRIVNLTYQGQPITSDMTFLVVMDSVETRYKFMPTDDNTILTTRLWTTSKDVLMDYIRDLNSFGPISVTADHNWSFTVPSSYRFVVAIPKEHESYVTSRDWYQSRVKKGSQYYYYLGKLKTTKQSTSVVLSPGILATTARAIPIRVIINHAPDVTITEVVYLSGNVQSAKSKRWDDDGILANDLSFKVRENGRYSVRVTDSKGNVTIAHINITNYSEGAMEAPRVNVPTNRISYISGTGVPGSTIHIALPDGQIIKGTVATDGSFKIDVPLPRSYELYSVWATLGKKTSQIVEVTVKKTGANQPTADPLAAGDTVVTGTADPYVTLSLRVGSGSGAVVYVGKGETAAYQASSIYKSYHVIQETEIIQNEDGTFSITLPKGAVSGKTYYLYATDRNGNASRIVNLLVP